MSIDEALRALEKKYRRLAGDHELNALEADSIGLNESAKSSDKISKFYEDVADELAALLTTRQEVAQVAEVVQREPYLDGSPNPMKALRWSLRNCEDDLPVGTKLYTTTGQTSDARDVVLESELEKSSGRACDFTWDAPVVLLDTAIALMRGQSEMVLVPRELTAENGAKAALISEFSFRDGLWNEHNVPWHVIKVIHKAMVAHFHPKQEPAE